MRELVRRLTPAVEAPLVIDSTEADVIEVALESYPGRPIVNSVHLGEEDRLRKVMPLVRDTAPRWSPCALTRWGWPRPPRESSRWLARSIGLRLRSTVWLPRISSSIP